MSLRAILYLTLVCAFAAPAGGQQPTAVESAQVIVHLVDYIGADYAGAVEEGRIKSEEEFQEMQEFSTQVSTLVAGLPADARRNEMTGRAQTLSRLVASKAASAEVARAAGELRGAIIQAYNVRVAPRQPPDLSAAPSTYRQLCGPCHGNEGRGDGPAGTRLEPRPANFTDRERMALRSVFGLYNAITLGVAGTSMAPFRQLSDEDRWALAFFVAQFPTNAGERARGEKLWSSGEGAQTLRDLSQAVTLSPSEIRARFGDEGVAVQAYLIANPRAFTATRATPIDVAITRVAESVSAYRAGDRARAERLALTAYLEGFELVEASLQNVDAELMRETEREMLNLRGLMHAGAAVEAVEHQATRVNAKLAESRRRLSETELSRATTFVSALLILLREGLEAILVIAAVVAFLIKANRRDALPYVHAGWLGAIALGLLTWAVATYVVDISGASREMTEGITALMAAAILVYVGYWLHSRASARAWQSFITGQVGAALAKRTLWAMAFVSFLAVYREMFEMVLFYQTLWIQAGKSGRGAFAGGLATAACALAALSWVIFRYSARLPLGPFFTGTSVLLCALAVVLAGKGVAALQEAGALPADALNVPSIPILGIFPTFEGLGAQVLVVIAVGIAFYSLRRANRAR